MFPNFLVIGAQKAGTTALYHFLSQHPDVFMSRVKEPNFFAFEDQELAFVDPDGRRSPINSHSVTDLADYKSLFSDATGSRAVGEASTSYLAVVESIDRIRRHVPEMKLIAVLRNPVDRAYSAYMHARREGREDRCFEEALDREDERIERNCGFIFRYTQLGLYHAQLEPYYRAFGDRLRVYLYDDLREDPLAVVADVYQFLGVTPEYVPDVSKRYNVSGEPRSTIVHNLTRFLLGSRLASFVKGITPGFAREMIPAGRLQRIVRRLERLNLRSAEMDEQTRARLTAYFAEDVLELSSLIGRDLSHWLDPT